MKLKIYTKRKKKEHRRTQTWRLNNILLNLWANHEIKEEIRKYLETNENGNAAPPNLQNVAKAVLRGKFIAINAFFKKVSNKQLNFTPQGTRKRRTNYAQI